MRDVLLGRTIRGDADLALEGDTAAFSSALAQRLGASRTVHERFGTAALSLPDGSRLDLASTRRETYPAPGVLPRIELGAEISEDLARRDFPVHAMAIEIGRRWRLVDPFGGRRDLASRRIRFLHPGSPADDPTRAFRAVRYANRLGFAVASEARRAITAAISSGAFEAVSGDRLRRELALIFSEPNRAGALSRLRALGLDRAVAPALARAAPGAASRARAVEALAREAGWLDYLLAWMAPLSARERQGVGERLALTGRERLAVLRWPRTQRLVRPGVARLSPSRLRQRLEGLSEEETLAAASALSGADRRAILRMLETAPAKLSISGRNLLAHGVSEGAALGRALAATRAAREDGRLDAKGELAFALRAARRPAGRRR